MKLILMGNGYWGSKLKRVFETQGHEFVDIVEEPRDGAEAIPTAMERGAQAAVIATPPLTHYRLTKAALEAGLDVLVEKPMAHDFGLALDLANLAFERARVLSVDSTFVHSDVFMFLKTQGELYSYQSLRLSPGPINAGNIDAGWDLVVHDLSILRALGAVSITRSNCLGSVDHETVQASILLRSGGVARIMASRMWPQKVREMVFWFKGSDQLLTWSGGNDVTDTTGRVVFEAKSEPLANLVSDFNNRCQYRKLQGITDGEHGAAVCELLQNLFGPCGGITSE